MQKQRKETITKWNDLQVVKELEELQIRDAFKKKLHTEVNVSQPGGRGSAKTLKIPYINYLITW